MNWHLGVLRAFRRARALSRPARGNRGSNVVLIKSWNPSTAASASSVVLPDADPGLRQSIVKALVNALDGLVFRPLSINDFLEIAGGVLERQRGIELCGNALCKPGIKKLVAAPKGNRARANDGNHFTFLYSVEKLIPESRVKFTQHALCRSRWFYMV